MSVAMSLLAILDETPSFGLRLKQEFESRTGGVWPLNVGQVYTTLERFERDGLARAIATDGGVQKRYEVTDEGRRRLADWFARPSRGAQPSREELVLKIVMAIRAERAAEVIQTERRRGVEQLQEYTRLKRGGDADDIGWAFLLDSLILQCEARVRWLDACEARLDRWNSEGRPLFPAPPGSSVGDEELNKELVR